MNPEEEKQLRALLFKKRQLPEPVWNLFARATKRMSKFRERPPSLQKQAQEKTESKVKKPSIQKDETS